MYRKSAYEPLLNHLGEDKIDIIKTLGSLPAGYTLNWLEMATFNANREHFVGSDPLMVDDYPSRVDADPYNLPHPGPDGRVRYATGLLGFSLKELDNGRRVCQDLVGGLPDELAEKYFNIRGVQALSPDPKAPALEQTICSTTWELVKPDFDPRRDKSPIKSKLGAGDQVLAAWSTHDVACPPDNRITVKGILHHSFILSSDEVQQQLGKLMGLPESSIKKVNSVPEIQIESLDEKLEADAERFVQGLHDFFQDPKNHFEEITETLDDGAHGLIRAAQPGKLLNNLLGVVAAVRGFSDDQRPKIIRRIIMSLCR